MSPCHHDLQAEAAALVQRLNGRWSAHGGMCRCPAHPDRTPSLSVRVGHHSLLLKCFAGCDTRDVLRALRSMGTDVPSQTAHPVGSISASPPNPAPIVRRLWATARPLSRTAGERYLATRGITRAYDALRFRPEVQLGPSGSAIYLPAMLAAVHDGEHLAAVQRIFLEPDGSALAHAIDPPRRLLGRPAAGAVRLAPAGDVLGLAEGVETALSAMILLNLPVWATLGSERLARVAVPPTVTRLILLPDDDRAGHIAERRARERYELPRRAIETVWPWGGLNDWNDVLRAEAKGEGRGRAL